SADRLPDDRANRDRADVSRDRIAAPVAAVSAAAGAVHCGIARAATTSRRGHAARSNATRRGSRVHDQLSRRDDAFPQTRTFQRASQPPLPLPIAKPTSCFCSLCPPGTDIDVCSCSQSVRQRSITLRSMRLALKTICALLFVL